MHNRKASRNDKEYGLLKAPEGLADLSLDHDIPISCLLDYGTEAEYINRLNDAYSDYLAKHENESHSAAKWASLFFKKEGTGFDESFRERLLVELERLFLEKTKLTIMYRKYNISKNNSFLYCRWAQTCCQSSLAKTLQAIHGDEPLKMVCPKEDPSFCAECPKKPRC